MPTYTAVRKDPKKETRALIIASMIGFLMIITLIAILPAGRMQFAKLFKAAPEDTSRTGLYNIGEVQLSLGSHAGYVSSNFDIEYDRQFLVHATKGEVSTHAKAKSFFDERLHTIQDAMITKTANFSSDAITGQMGTDRLKSYLINSINKALKNERGLVTNVYFRSLIIYGVQES